MDSSILSIGGIVLIFVIMYFLMIRPQRKKEKQITQMRNSLKVGDKIVTIGGFKGQIVTIKEKDEALVVAMGADKVKMEVMRWAISRVDEDSVKKSGAAGSKSADKTKDAAKDKEEDKKEEAPAKKPKRLGAKAEDAADEKKADEVKAEDKKDE
jgi:preprotein translocase subunit YajC